MKKIIFISLLFSLWSSLIYGSIVPDYCYVDAGYDEFSESEKWSDKSECISKKEMATNFVVFMRACGLPIANYNSTPALLLALNPSSYLFSNTSWDSSSLGFYFFDKSSDRDLMEFIREMDNGGTGMGISDYGYILLGDEELGYGVKVAATCSGRIYNISL